MLVFKITTGWRTREVKFIKICFNKENKSRPSPTIFRFFQWVTKNKATRNSCQSKPLTSVVQGSLNVWVGCRLQSAGGSSPLQCAAPAVYPGLPQHCPWGKPTPTSYRNGCRRSAQPYIKLKNWGLKCLRLSFNSSGVSRYCKRLFVIVNK